MHISGIPSRSTEESGVPADKGHRSDSIFAGIELWGGRFDDGSLGRVLKQEQCLSNRASDGGSGAGDEAAGLLQGYRTKAIGADLTSVKCNGKWLSIGVVVDPINGLVLCVDHLDGEDAQTLKDWVEPIADQVGAETLVTDDADAFKEVAEG